MSAERVVDGRRVEPFRARPLDGPAKVTRSWPLERSEVSGKAELRDPLEVEREAFEKGFASGERAGLQTAAKKSEAVLKRFCHSLEQLTRLREGLIAGCERDVVALAVEIASKLVRREISLDEQIIAAFVRVALEKLDIRGKVVVRLHPADCEFIRRNLDDTFFDKSDIDIALKPREDLSRGDCLIESEYGIVDARICEQVREIEQELLGF